MDGKGRWVDNVIIERFWRTVKYEQIFLNPPDNIEELKRQITRFIHFYNYQRLLFLYFGQIKLVIN